MLASAPPPVTNKAEEKKTAQPKQKQEKKPKTENKSGAVKNKATEKTQESSGNAPSFSFLYGMLLEVERDHKLTL